MKLIFLSGAVANKPFNGGNAWSRVSWIEGFRRAGYEVCFVEQIGAAACVDGQGRSAPFRQSANLAYFKQVMEQFKLGSAFALVLEGGHEVYGLPMADLVRRAREAAFLFNFSGHLTQPELRSSFQRQIYYDDDPGFTQFWHAAGQDSARLTGHQLFFTLGANIGHADCPIPTSAIQWRHTRPPVVLDHWPVSDRATLDRFTTVASWRGAYGPVEYGGKTYGLKVHEFRKYIELPRRAEGPFEIALQIHPADQKDRAALQASGWRVVDPHAVADTPDAFRRYVQESGAEFSVAQGIYVDTNSGWFSDRTVRYLASGRPALVQDTGFSRHLPVGEGLVAFRSLEEAIDGAARIRKDYRSHAQAARRIAEQYFSVERVIGRLLDDIGCGE